jgi:hypothetical protein
MTGHRRLVFATLLMGALLAPLALLAQDLHPSRRPSPVGWSRIALGDTYISIVYGQPYKRGRNNIFGTKESGAVVPFGERWRTGANEASEITFTRGVQIAGKPLAAGTYSLFTTPRADSWTVHLNSRLGLDGLGMLVDGKFTEVNLDPTDVLTVTAKPTTLAEEVDQFTIAFERAKTGADLVMRWIRTEVRVPIATTAK